MTTNEVPATKAAVIRRINRKLREHSQVLKFARNRRVRIEVGKYYVVNTHYDLMVEKDVDIEDMARALEVLALTNR